MPPLISVNPFKLFLWTFRRTPSDVIDLYNTLSPVMQLATGGNMLNFGYWNGSDEPLSAQRRLCELVGNIGELSSAKKLVDLGSGLGAPARYWASMYDLDIVCININRQQLAGSMKPESGDYSGSKGPMCVNATSVTLPLPDKSADRIIALESAQHFRPLSQFMNECRRVLAPGGILIIAIPVTVRPLQGISKLMRLGILSLTWSSEHYPADEVSSALTSNGFKVTHVQRIGRQVYEPLTGYYVQNRQSIRQRILEQYPSFLESILHRSLLKMRQTSESGLIDYLVIKAT
jgi:cyclopropane fatty-acyl-phospholipid synthase-like methyltransferase